MDGVDDSRGREGWGCWLLLWTPAEIVFREMRSVDIIAFIPVGRMPLFENAM